MKKLLFFLVAVMSIRAQAAEILVKVADKVFSAKLPEGTQLNSVSANQIIDLLKSAEIREVKVVEPSFELNSDGIPVWMSGPYDPSKDFQTYDPNTDFQIYNPKAKPGYWTDKQSKPGSWTETQSRTGTWTESQSKTGTWTESSKQNGCN